MPKYTAKPKISLKVVIKGPEAAAGFMSNLSNIIGVMVPESEAKSTTQAREIDTIIEIFISPRLK